MKVVEGVGWEARAEEASVLQRDESEFRLESSAFTRPMNSSEMVLEPEGNGQVRKL